MSQAGPRRCARVDWFRVIVDIQRRGVSVNEIARRLDRSHSAVLQWQCHRCSKPTRIIVYPKSRSLPNVFECPVNRFAPFANSINCKGFQQEPGIEELWEGDPAMSAYTSSGVLP